MENASKALIIAGAILIAILLIVLGIWIFNSNKGIKDNALKTGEITSDAMTEVSTQIRDDLGVDTIPDNSASGSNGNNPAPGENNPNEEIARTGPLPTIDQNGWHIWNKEQFKFFADFVNNKLTEEEKQGYPEITEDTIVYLENNIDLLGENWTPIGNLQAPFIGIFNGKYKTISNINIDSSDNYIGLFGHANNTIGYLTVTNSNIKGKNYVGGIVGTGKNVVDCKSENSKIEGENYVGGIIGYSLQNSEINNCINNSKVTCTNTYVGGIVGIARNNSKIARCTNEGEVINQVSERTGGIAGQIANGIITYCKNTGNVTGKANVGGIAGIIFNESDVNKSYNSGTITGNAQCVGGICGQTGMNTHSYIQQCYNKGKVIGEYNDSITSIAIGGIVGWISQTDSYNYIRNNYNIGEIELRPIVSTSLIGGIIGRAITNYYEEYDNYYLEGTSNITLNNKSTSKTSNEMKTEEFVNLLNNGLSERVWEIRNGINDGYPVIVGIEY